MAAAAMGRWCRDVAATQLPSLAGDYDCGLSGTKGRAASEEVTCNRVFVRSCARVRVIGVPVAPHEREPGRPALPFVKISCDYPL